MDARDWSALGRPGRRPQAARARLGVAGVREVKGDRKPWTLRPWCACVGWGPNTQH